MASFSEQPWVEAACRARLAVVVPRLEELASPFGLRSIFLGGSASIGEAVGWEGDARFVLSDLDLGVITDRPLPPPVTAEMRAMDEGSGGGPVVHVGSYLVGQQHLQEPTLGLWDAVEKGMVLLGDPRWLSRFRASFPSHLPAWEAYRLVGNRSLELLQTGGFTDASETIRAQSCFAMGKLATGLATAQLVLQGRYVPGRQVRFELLDASSVASLVRSAALDWRSFLARPSPTTVPALTGALTRVRQGLVALFEEHGYWTDVSSPDGPEDAFLAPRVRVRSWLRAWRREGRILVRSGAWRTTFRGTPESRRLGLAALYWACAPELPEPHWGADTAGSDAERWSRGAVKLTGRPLPGGHGCRIRTVQWIRESSRGVS